MAPETHRATQLIRIVASTIAIRMLPKITFCLRGTFGGTNLKQSISIVIINSSFATLSDRDRKLLYGFMSKRYSNTPMIQRFAVSICRTGIEVIKINRAA